MSVAGRLGLTAWRRKSTLLGGVAALALVVLCLQYSALPARPVPGETAQQQSLRTLRYLPKPAPINLASGNRVDAPPAEVVRFVQPVMRPKSEIEPPPVREQIDEERARVVATGESPSREDVQRARQQSRAQTIDVNQNLEEWDEMGVARIALDPRNPFIPRHRLVHLDLKGAPPKVSYLKKLLPMLKQLGATGLLLEWEDMFPFTGALARVSATNHYSPAEVRAILVQAKELGLEAVPLIQTFGHLEFVLKLEAFSNLREVPEIPQAVCPSLNESLALVGRMVDQVVKAHAAVSMPRYIHIGCDEVFTMGECSRCRQKPRDDLFLHHVARVAKMVRDRYNAVPIIWDDMLRHVQASAMQEFDLGELVEPMVWVYAENVYRFVLPGIWSKYATVFPRVWTASAFKGAFGETLYVPNVKRHLENNLRWLEVMTNENSQFKEGFAGIALTGWQRYDHFAVLCELLPQSVPSLALSLAAVTHGYFNTSLRASIQSVLHCPPSRTTQPSAFLNLNTDPYLWDRFSSCNYPGIAAFRLTARLESAEREVEEFLTAATKKRGWLTDYNVRNNFTSPLRIDELMADHSRLLHTMMGLVRNAKDALSDAFDAHTVGEWIEQRILPYIARLEQLQRDTDRLREVRTWPVRPLGLDVALRRLGIEVPAKDAKQSSRGKK